MKRKAYYFLSLLVFWGCGEKKSPESETGDLQSDYIMISKKQFEASGMVLGSLEERVFPEVVSASGLIDVPPENRATVSAVMGGYIKKTPLIVGDIIKKGQVLATLENPEYIKLQQEYLEVKERLNYLKSEYNRHKILFNEKITSQKNYLKTESEFKTARARFNGLRKQLDILNISPSEVEKGNITATVSLYAPISGSVTEVFVSKGAYVSPASPVVEVVDNDHIHLELSVYERDIMRVEKGQPILFKVPEASDQTYEAQVYLAGTTIGENRTIKVHGHLKDERHRFLTGMFIEAQIFTKTETAMALPSQAIVEVDGKPFVLRLVSQDNTGYFFEQVPLKKEVEHDGFTKIENPEILDNGNQYLVKGAFDIIGIGEGE